MRPAVALAQLAAVCSAAEAAPTQEEPPHLTHSPTVIVYRQGNARDGPDRLSRTVNINFDLDIETVKVKVDLLAGSIMNGHLS